MTNKEEKDCYKKKNIKKEFANNNIEEVISDELFIAKM